MTLARIAFYAPIKPPDHPIASGDREIARLIVRALGMAGHDVDLASKCIAYVKRPDADDFREKKARAQAEVERILAAVKSGDAAPDAWLTYHPYCKAPDWIGPEVCRALQIPYATVEACHSSQKDHPVWEQGRAQVRDGVNLAATNFCLKPTDRRYLETILHKKDTIFDLAPFIDTSEIKVSPGHSPPRFCLPDFGAAVPSRSIYPEILTIPKGLQTRHPRSPGGRPAWSCHHPR